MNFVQKKTWQRLLIMLGGVMVNFIFALVIYAAILYVWGEEYLPTKNAKFGIAVDSLAYKAGLRNGDFILSVDNKEVENFNKIPYTILINQAKSIQVRRDSQVLNIQLPETLTRSLIKSKSREFISIRIPYVIDKFSKESAAQLAGFKKGDKMLALNGEQAMFYDQFKTILAKNKNKEIIATVERNGKPLDIKVKIPETGLLGIYNGGNLSEYFLLKHIEYGFFESIPAGISKGFSTLTDYISQFKLIFSSKVKGYESLGGFITMGSIFPGVWDWASFWSLTAFLSIILAFMNILPIPALDGGHVLFLLYEIVTGRKPSDKFLEYAQIVGLVILVGLLLYANLNDVFKLFMK